MGVGGWGESDGAREGEHGGVRGGLPSAVSAAAVEAVAAQKAAGIIVFSIIVFLNNVVPLYNSVPQ